MLVDARLHLLVGVVVCCALLAMAVAALTLRDDPVPETWKLALVALLLPMSERALLHVRFGAHQYSFTWGEACIVIGFATICPAWLVLIAGPAVTAVHLSAHRGWLKSLFNGASFTLATAVAAAGVENFAAEPYRLTTVRDAVVLLVSVSMFSAISALLTSCVVAVAQGRHVSDVLSENARMLFAIWSGNMLAAAAMLFVVETNALLL